MSTPRTRSTGAPPESGPGRRADRRSEGRLEADPAEGSNGSPGEDPNADAYGRRSLSRSTTDRDAARRADPGLLAGLASDPATRLVVVDARGRVALDVPAVHPDLPDDGLTPPAPSDRDRDVWEADGPASPRPRLAPLTIADLGGAPLPPPSPPAPTARGTREAPPAATAPTALAALTGLTTIYLGRETGTGTGDAAGAPWLGVVIPDASTDPTDAEGADLVHKEVADILERYPLSALRAVGHGLSAHDAGLAAPAVALAAWHARARFCTACGGRTRAEQAGWTRRCTACGAIDFPRADPAVIMAVTDDADRIVLVHGARWDAGRYSTVAGFVEAGESGEAAVVREVAEETGLRVETVEFVASQPWPFPRSLMLGYRARLAPGEHLAHPDGEEVTDALVLSRAELDDALGTGAVVLPGPTSIARMLIEDWYGGPIR